MPLDVTRLRKSDTRLRTKAEEFRAAITLWGAAWHELPAGSLPDDDVALADLAGYGIAVREWKKVRAGALRGFVKCSDGRLYHKVIVGKAVNAWRSLLERQHTNECGRLKKEYQRHRTPEQERRYPTFETFVLSHCPEAAPHMSLGTLPIVPRDNAPSPPNELPVSPGKSALTDRIQNIEETTSPQASTSVGGQPVDNSGQKARTSKPSYHANDTTQQRRLRERGWRLGLEPGKDSWEAFEQRVKGAELQAKAKAAA